LLGTARKPNKQLISQQSQDTKDEAYSCLHCIVIPPF